MQVFELNPKQVAHLVDLARRFQPKWLFEKGVIDLVLSYVPNESYFGPYRTQDDYKVTITRPSTEFMPTCDKCNLSDPTVVYKFKRSTSYLRLCENCWSKLPLYRENEQRNYFCFNMSCRFPCYKCKQNFWTPRLTKCNTACVCANYNYDSGACYSSFCHKNENVRAHILLCHNCFSKLPLSKPATCRLCQRAFSSRNKLHRHLAVAHKSTNQQMIVSTGHIPN